MSEIHIHTHPACFCQYLLTLILDLPPGNVLIIGESHFDAIRSWNEDALGYWLRVYGLGMVLVNNDLNQSSMVIVYLAAAWKNNSGR